MGHGHNYIGHSYIGHSYIGREAMGHGHNYIGHNYKGHNYIGREAMSHGQEFRRVRPHATHACTHGRTDARTQRSAAHYLLDAVDEHDAAVERLHWPANRYPERFPSLLHMSTHTA